jgi:hypothetical protein
LGKTIGRSQLEWPSLGVLPKGLDAINYQRWLQRRFLEREQRKSVRARLIVELAVGYKALSCHL